jgi:hypothetical protein
MAKAKFERTNRIVTLVPSVTLTMVRQLLQLLSQRFFLRE